MFANTGKVEFMKVEAILILSMRFKMLPLLGMLDFGCSEPHPGSCLSSMSTFLKLDYELQLKG